MTALMRPAFDAGVALTRLDERIARSPVGQGWIERQNFADACAWWRRLNLRQGARLASRQASPID
ncbi:hypothetical protein [Agrobacterium salinitolerans]|uniref:hypothetical protein n=1 Tax=Agrobacterium salinitolerans TaxID=1183413 RepID=UPI001573E179|nr:hypothetical protein [Agrobacterium salinitolerans]NTA35528.1 hypothetical protein [Agrobacterium salinitolerans]